MSVEKISEATLLARQLDLLTWQTLLVAIQIGLGAVSVVIAFKCQKMASECKINPFIQTLHMKQLDVFNPLHNLIMEFNRIGLKMKAICEGNTNEEEKKRESHYYREMGVLLDKVGDYFGEYFLYMPEKLANVMVEYIDSIGEAASEEDRLDKIKDMLSKGQVVVRTIREILGLEQLNTGLMNNILKKSKNK